MSDELIQNDTSKCCCKKQRVNWAPVKRNRAIHQDVSRG